MYNIKIDNWKKSSWLYFITWYYFKTCTYNVKVKPDLINVVEWVLAHNICFIRFEILIKLLLFPNMSIILLSTKHCKFCIMAHYFFLKYLIDGILFWLRPELNTAYPPSNDVSVGHSPQGRLQLKPVQWRKISSKRGIILM